MKSSTLLFLLAPLFAAGQTPAYDFDNQPRCFFFPVVSVKTRIDTVQGIAMRVNNRVPPSFEFCLARQIREVKDYSSEVVLNTRYEIRAQLTSGYTFEPNDRYCCSWVLRWLSVWSPCPGEQIVAFWPETADRFTEGSDK